MLPGTTFSTIPRNRNRRASILRAARLGTRAVASPVDVGDALRVVDAVRAVRAGWLADTSDAVRTVRDAWDAAHP